MSKKSIGLKRRVHRKASLLLNREIKTLFAKDNFKDMCIDKKLYSITYDIVCRLDSDNYRNVLGHTHTNKYQDKNGNVLRRDAIIYCYYNQILKHTLFLYNKFKFTGISYNTVLSNTIESTVIHEVRHVYQYLYNTFNLQSFNDCAEIDATVFAFMEMIKRKDRSLVSIVFDRKILNIVNNNNINKK